MMDVKVAFKPLEDGDNLTIGCTFVLCHMIFNVKMKDFCRKARIVASTHMTETSDTMTYARVVSCETICLDLVISAMENMELKFVDVMNLHITSPIQEKIWTTLGPDFGLDSSKTTLVVHALYGLKSARAAFRSYLDQCIQGLVYKP